MFLFGYICPTWSTVTPVGLKVLGAFIGWLILVISGKGMVIASCLSFFALAMSGYQTPGELFAAGFGTTGLLQFVYAFLISGAFSRSGAGETIVRWALSRKFLNGKPTLFMFIWWTAMTILGALTTNVVACMMLGFSLVVSIAKVVGYDVKDNWCRFMIAGTVMVGGTAGTLLPFQGPPAMAYAVFDGYAESIGITMSRAYYCGSIVITSILVIFAFTFLMKPILKLNTTPLKTMDVATLTEGHSTKLNTQQTVITVLMIVAYIYPVLLMPLSKEATLYTTLNTIGQSMFMGLVVAAFALLHKDGKPFYDLEKHIGEDVMWGAIAAYALVVVAAGAIASDAAGIKDWLYLVISGAISNMPLALVIVIFVLVAVYLTQVFFQYGDHHHTQLHHRSDYADVHPAGLQRTGNPGVPADGRYERHHDGRRFRICSADARTALLRGRRGGLGPEERRNYPAGALRLYHHYNPVDGLSALSEERTTVWRQISAKSKPWMISLPLLTNKRRRIRASRSVGSMRSASSSGFRTERS